MNIQTSPQFSAEEKLLLAGSSLQPDAEALFALLPQINNWNVLVKKAMVTHLAPLLFRNLNAFANDGLVPKDALTALQKSYHGVLAANIRLYAHLGPLLVDWNLAGIPIIVLKGMFLAEMVYVDVGLRHISDLDLLVHDADVERCKHWAEKNGWTVEEMPHHSAFLAENFGSAHPFKFIKENAVIELHVHVHNKGRTYAIEIADYWRQAQSGFLSGGTAMHLHPSHLIQHLCLHLYKHMEGSQLKISSFCDIRESIAHYGDAIDWQLLRQSSIRYNAWNEVQSVLHLCQQFWGAAVPQVALAGLSPVAAGNAQKIFLDFFMHGTPSSTTRMARNLDGNLDRLAQLNGVTAKARYLSNYLFPSNKYLRQRYQIQGPVLVFFKCYHPLKQGFRGLLALVTKSFS